MHQSRSAPKSIRLREMCAKIVFFFALAPLFYLLCFASLVCRRHSIYFLKNKWVNEQMSKWESLTPWKAVVQWVEYRDNINVFQPLMSIFKLPPWVGAQSAHLGSHWTRHGKVVMSAGVGVEHACQRYSSFASNPQFYLFFIGHQKQTHQLIR